jgi:hypothetical protein
MKTQSVKQEFDAAPWTGRVRKYDIVKEATVAIVIVSMIVVLLSLIFSSPDDKQLTFRDWAQTNPTNFYATTVQELAGTSESAGYGPPYNSASDGLNIGPLWLQKWAGVTHPIDVPNDLVITPLSLSVLSSSEANALTTWKSATADQQIMWATAYDDAITGADGDYTAVTGGDFGPVPVLANALTNVAAQGSLDALLLAGGNFYSTDNTKQILFFGDGAYLDDAATAANLQGNTWGMMNETGRYPGQAWLWLYSIWYQVPPFTNEESAPFGSNADAYIMFVVLGLTAGLMFVPLIPGLRSIPRVIPLHRKIWKAYYKEENIKRLN